MYLRNVRQGKDIINVDAASGGGVGELYIYIKMSFGCSFGVGGGVKRPRVLLLGFI